MLPRRSNWNLSPSTAFASDGTAYAPFITSFDCGLRSPSQSSSSAGFWIGKTSKQVSGTLHYNRHLQQEEKEENIIPLKETVSQTIWLQPWVAQPQEKALQPSVIRPTQIVDESEIKSYKKNSNVQKDFSSLCTFSFVALEGSYSARISTMLSGLSP